MQKELHAATTSISLRLPSDLYQEFKTMCQDSGVSMTQCILDLIVEATGLIPLTNIEKLRMHIGKESEPVPELSLDEQRRALIAKARGK